MICWIVSFCFSLSLNSFVSSSTLKTSRQRSSSILRVHVPPSLFVPLYSLKLTRSLLASLSLFFPNNLDPRSLPTTANDEHDDLDDEIRKLEEGEADDDHHIHQPSSSASAATLGLLTSPKSRPTSPPAVLRAAGGEGEAKP